MSLLVTLGALVDALGGELLGPRDRGIARLASLTGAGPDDLAFVAQARYAGQIAQTQAACLVVAPSLRPQAEARGACIVTPDPYLYYARLSQWWRLQQPRPSPVVHATAVIDASAQLGAGVEIGPWAVLGAGVQIGADVRIGAHCVLGDGVVLGARTRLHPGVRIAEACSIGSDGILHSGVVIGADGFGFAKDADGHWVKIEQLGAVRIGNGVEIGANSCIDRGALDDTVIEDGVKLDNLVQIGHNVRVGAHTAMAGCAGVAGSAQIGAHCTVGGGAVVLGHLRLADGVHISAASVVSRSILRPGHYTGMFPIDENATWEKNAASLKQLNRLRERLKRLEAQIGPERGGPHPASSTSNPTATP